MTCEMLYVDILQSVELLVQQETYILIMMEQIILPNDKELHAKITHVLKDTNSEFRS